MSATFDRLRAVLSDRYQIDSQVGNGGLVTVYHARDIRHDPEAAIKALRPELAQAVGSERFLREVKIAARLQHPHILPLHDSEADNFLSPLHQRCYNDSKSH